jgi:hypothetical protein
MFHEARSNPQDKAVQAAMADRAHADESAAHLRAQMTSLEDVMKASSAEISKASVLGRH